MRAERGRRNTYQFIFVKKLDERRGDEGVESLQEGVYLRLDGSCHPQLRHQLDVLRLRKHSLPDQSPSQIQTDKRRTEFMHSYSFLRRLFKALQDSTTYRRTAELHEEVSTKNNNLLADGRHTVCTITDLKSHYNQIQPQ